MTDFYMKCNTELNWVEVLLLQNRKVAGLDLNEHSAALSYTTSSPSMKLTLSWWGGLSRKKFEPSVSTRAQLSFVATTVRSKDLLNCYTKSWVNID